MRIEHGQWSESFSYPGGLIMGIDPGLSSMGVILIDPLGATGGTIRTKPGVSLGDRYQQIRLELESFYWGAVGGNVIETLVVEHMQVYRQRKTDPNSLIHCAVAGGIAIGMVPGGRVITPRAQVWKGSVPKKIHHMRLASFLSNTPKWSEHAWDAFGLALYGLEQLNA